MDASPPHLSKIVGSQGPLGFRLNRINQKPSLLELHGYRHRGFWPDERLAERTILLSDSLCDADFWLDSHELLRVGGYCYDGCSVVCTGYRIASHLCCILVMLTSIEQLMLAIDYRMTYRAVTTDPSVTDTFSFWARASMRSLFFAHRYALHLLLDASSRACLIRERVHLVRTSFIIPLAFQAQRSYQLRRFRPPCSKSRPKRHRTHASFPAPVPLGHHQLEPLGYVATANLDRLRRGLQGSWGPPSSGSLPYSLPFHLSRAGHALLSAASTGDLRACGLSNDAAATTWLLLSSAALPLGGPRFHDSYGPRCRVPCLHFILEALADIVEKPRNLPLLVPSSSSPSRARPRPSRRLSPPSISTWSKLGCLTLIGLRTILTTNPTARSFILFSLVADEADACTAISSAQHHLLKFVDDFAPAPFRSNYPSASTYEAVPDSAGLWGMFGGTPQLWTFTLPSSLWSGPPLFQQSLPTPFRNRRLIESILRLLPVAIKATWLVALDRPIDWLSTSILVRSSGSVFHYQPSASLVVLFVMSGSAELCNPFVIPTSRTTLMRGSVLSSTPACFPSLRVNRRLIGLAYHFYDAPSRPSGINGHLNVSSLSC